ncbi:Gypsy retrotransposon integrase-like protein 1 [Stygiomarasmius scandens]|uniref:Gypsy retrotransposon integrase-like protein 1 n=1 Tax=Marasmiellus scandens TaxID=2682957 RepID=A0ABR1ISI3_9AGAR
MSDSAAFVTKKRRTQNACDDCRKRKSDSANMPGNICSNCIAFQCECTHVLANARKKRGPPKGQPKGTRTIASVVSAILSPSKPYSAPEDPETVKQLLIDLASHIRVIEEELEQLRPLKDKATPSTHADSSPSSSPGPSNDIQLQSSPSKISPSIRYPFAISTSPPVRDGAAEEGLSEMVKRLVFDQQATTRLYGDSGAIGFVKDAIDIHGGKEGTEEEDTAPFGKCASSFTQTALPSQSLRRPEVWTIYPWQLPPDENLPPLEFPSDDLLPSLVDLYFTSTNRFLPLLHRPTFEKNIRQRLHYRDRQFGYVVLTVCAIGARHSSDSRVYYDESRNEFSVGWRWFRQVKMIKSSFTNPPTLYELQLCVAAVMFLQCTSTPEACWILSSLGIRYAQDVGAHRRRAGKPTVERELWKRAFWCLYILDVFVSAFMGRPRATSADDCDADLPIECDDEYWETEDPEQAFKQPSGKPSYMSAWSTFVKLLDIMSIAQRTIYAVRRSDFWTAMGMSGPEWNEKVVSELDSLLNNWVDSIPDHLRWDPNREDPVFFDQSVMLYTSYYWVQMVVHKPFIPKPGSASKLSFPSMAICANAARSCCHVMEVQQKRGFLTMPNVMMALHNSAVVLLLNAWRGKYSQISVDTNKEMMDVYKCMNMIRTYETRWQSGGTYTDVLRELIKITNVHGNSATAPSRPSLKRVRDSEATGHSSGSSNTAQPAQESREIAGSNRVAAAIDSHSPRNVFVPDISQGQAFPNNTFNLPMYSTELGSLPVHESFNPVQGGQSPSAQDAEWMEAMMGMNYPQQSSTYTWPGAGISADPHPVGDTQTHIQQAVPDTIFPLQAMESNGGDMTYAANGGQGHLQESHYIRHIMAESLYNAIHTPQPGQTHINDAQVPGDVQQFENGTNWQDWDKCMANVDQLLYAMNNTAHQDMW